MSRKKVYKNKKKKEEIQKSVESTINFLGNGFENLNMSRDKVASLFRFNIAFKLTLELTMLFVGILIVINLIISFAGSYYFYYTGVNELESYNNLIVEEFVENQGIDNNIKKLLDDRKIYYLVSDLDNNIIDSSDEIDINYDNIVNSNDYNIFNIKLPDYLRHEKLLMVDDPQVFDQETSEAKIGIKFLVYKKMTFSNNSLYILRFLMGIISIAICLIIWKATSENSKKHLKPIIVMNEKINEISTSNLSTRLDISGTKDELKDLAQTFNLMLDEIEVGYDSQRRFVSDASHELRTPIAVIKGYGNMLKRWGKEDSEILEESIDAIIDETENMQSLVESLLFIARNDKSSLSMELADFNISDLIREVVKETSMIDSNHKISSEILYEGNYYGCCEKLKQALRVFVDNSIKYTPDGGNIFIRLRQSQNSIFISVEDDGIGISEEDLPKIFDRFYRADKSRTKLGDSNKTGGTGLGLAIAKIIIEKHGGSLHIESKLNQGTKITVILPKKNI